MHRALRLSCGCSSRALPSMPEPAAPQSKQTLRAVAAPERETSVRRPRSENVPGQLYVDHTCIGEPYELSCAGAVHAPADRVLRLPDCDTCRWMCPSVFRRVGEQTAVHAQPSTPEERLSAHQALLACPTCVPRAVAPVPCFVAACLRGRAACRFSIHSSETAEVRAAAESYPRPVQGTRDVMHNGFHSEDSYASASWFIRRPAGNVMIDSPRFDRRLLKRIQVRPVFCCRAFSNLGTVLTQTMLQAAGGCSYMFLTHKDDVCDHAKWAEALGLQRIIHKGEVTRRQGTECAPLCSRKGVVLQLSAASTSSCACSLQQELAAACKGKSPISLKAAESVVRWQAVHLKHLHLCPSSGSSVSRRLPRLRTGKQLATHSH